MGKKNRKKKQEQEAQVASTPASPLNQGHSPDMVIGIQAFLIFLLAFVLYGNTFFHKYAVDDTIVITKNTLTQQGFEGIPTIMTTDAFYGFFGPDGYKLVAGGRYRPLSIVTFAIEVELFGPDHPGISHAINVLIYAFLGVLLFFTLMLMFPTAGYGKYYLSIPFIATLLYIAHPIHTEAVANIKGRDEIMGMLGAIATLYFSLRYAKSENLIFIPLALFSFVFALLSKENPITFLAVVPLTYFFFTKAKVGQYLVMMAPLIVIAGIYVYMRKIFTDVDLSQNSSEILNNPFVGSSTSEILATVSFTFWEYIRLLIFPHPLTYDYYFNQVPIINWGSYKAILPLILNLAIIGWAVKGLFSKNPFSYAILYYFITLSVVSNIFFTVGIAMNERFVFMPSLGYCIILAMLLVMAGNYFSNKQWTWKKLVNPTLTIAALSVILLGFSVKTITRNVDWERDFTIFKADVKNSPNSAKVHNAYGGELLAEAERTNNLAQKKEYWEEAVRVQTRALEIYPTYVNAWLILGNAIYKLREFDNTALNFPINVNGYKVDNTLESAIFCYKKTLEIRPGYYEGNFNLGCVLSENKQHKESVPYFLQAIATKPERHEASYNLAEAYAEAGNPDKAIEYYKKVIDLRPDISTTYYKVGVTYGKMKNDLPKSIEWIQKAIEIDPNVAVYYKDLGVAYGFNQDFANAVKSLEKAGQLNPQDAEVFTNLGVTYKLMNDQQKSTTYFNKALELQLAALNNAPNNLALYRAVISTYQALENQQKMEEYFYKARQVDPNFQF